MGVDAKKGIPQFSEEESPATSPMPPVKSEGEEDIIVPEFKPLLGGGDTGPATTNITEEEAFRLLREALESDSANRSEIVDLTGWYDDSRQ